MNSLFLYILMLLVPIYLAITTRAGRSPFFWIYWPWVIAFAPVFSGLIHYSNPSIDSSTVVFVIMHLSVITVGYMLAALSWGKATFSGIVRSENGSAQTNERALQIQDPREIEIRTYGRLIDSLVLIGALGVLLFVADAFFVSGFTSSNAFEMRQLFVETQVNPIRRLAPILAMGCFVALMAIFWFGQTHLKRRFYWYSIVALSITTFSFLSAGRQAIFQFILFCFIAWLIVRGRSRGYQITIRGLLTSLAILVVVAFLVVQMINLSSERSDTPISDQLGILLSIFGAQLDPEFEALISTLSEQLAVGLTSGLLYFSSQLSSLAAIVDRSASETWATGAGVYQFPWVYRRLEFLGISSIDQILSERRSYLAVSGYMSVSWSTALATFLHDFGYAGSFIYSFAVGVLGGYVWTNHKQKGNFFSFCLLVSSFAYLFYLIMFPLSSDTILFFFILTVFVLDRRCAKVTKSGIVLRTLSLRIRGH